MSGKNNEDRYGVVTRPEGEDSVHPYVLAVVADGIGGHRAGEVAAELAVQTITQLVAAGDLSHPEETLRNAVRQANEEVHRRSQDDITRQGMGATCACVWIVGPRFYGAWVGDSRIYLLRQGHLHQLTTDHTWVQEAIQQGVISPEEGRKHPNAHVIRRYLGSPQPVEPDMRLRKPPNADEADAHGDQVLRLLPGDQLLLCTDGLTDLVENEEIQQILQTHDQEDALDLLVELANQRGGHDNITIVALQTPVPVGAAGVVEGETARVQTAMPQKPVRTASREQQAQLWGLPCAVLAFFIVVGVVFALALFLFLNYPLDELLSILPISRSPEPVAATSTLQPLREDLAEFTPLTPPTETPGPTTVLSPLPAQITTLPTSTRTSTRTATPQQSTDTPVALEITTTP